MMWKPFTLLIIEENVTFVVGFQKGIKSKFKALNVFVIVFVFLDKFSLFHVKSVVCWELPKAQK